MKLLTWLLKRSPLTNKHSLLIIGIVIGITFVVVFSCHLHRNEQRKLENLNSMGSSLSSAEIFSQYTDENTFVILNKTSQNRLKIAEPSKSACATTNDKTEPQPNRDIVLKILLASAFGEHVVNITFSNKPEDTSASVNVSSTQLMVNLDPKTTNEFIGEICKLTTGGIGELELAEKSPATLAFFNLLLTRISPDCQPLASLEKGVFCTIESRATNAEYAQLKYTRQIMINRWNRQPYLLSRRLFVTMMLAEALNTPVPTERLNNFCKVIGFAENEELPLAMGTARWKSAVCTKANETRLAVAAVGLRKAVMEIDFLRNLYEKNAKPGTLRVAVPANKAPTKDLWISLEPKEDVAAKLKTNSLKEHKKANDKLADSDEPKTCWHPFFAETPAVLQLARHMQLMNETLGVTCIDSAGQLTQTAHKADNYFTESITSESEFVITNGKTKMLRLPEGTYKYTIRAHADDLGWENLPDVSSTGEIQWTNKRPSAAISSW